MARWLKTQHDAHPPPYDFIFMLFSTHINFLTASTFKPRRKLFITRLRGKDWIRGPFLGIYLNVVGENRNRIFFFLFMASLKRNSLSHSGNSSLGGGFGWGAWLHSGGWLIRSLAPYVWKFEEVLMWGFHPEGLCWQMNFIIGFR